MAPRGQRMTAPDIDLTALDLLSALSRVEEMTGFVDFYLQNQVFLAEPCVIILAL